MVNFINGNFIIFTVSMLFLFSVGYTLMYYYQQASDQAATEGILPDVDETGNIAPTDDSIISSITSGFVDNVLGFLAVINPFGLIILFLKAIMPSDAYTLVNLLFLRPIGWTGTIITSNYVISKIRGTTE